MTQENYDCSYDTYVHVRTVQKVINGVIKELLDRSNVHDSSKFEEPEHPIFNKYTPKLKGVTYGSSEYLQFLKEMKPALDNHYANNSHHPEYHGGLENMSLVDLIDMLCDWKASTLRHNDGDINKSIEINQKRFGYDDQLKKIFQNTVKYLKVD